MREYKAKKRFYGSGLDLGARGMRARICKLYKEPRNLFPAWRNRFLVL